MELLKKKVHFLSVGFAEHIYRVSQQKPHLLHQEYFVALLPPFLITYMVEKGQIMRFILEFHFCHRNDN